MNHLPKTVAVDFDGTLCEVAYPDIGSPKIDIINYVKRLRESGWAIILWTNREGALLEEALEWCNGYGLAFDAVNENLPERTAFYGNDCRKIGADLYIDDKSVHPDLLQYVLDTFH